MTCGNPDRKLNSTVVGRNFSMGASIEYRCPTGSVLLGSNNRTCQSNGLWSKEAPTCKRKKAYSIIYFLRNLIIIFFYQTLIVEL